MPAAELSDLVREVAQLLREQVCADADQLRAQLRKLETEWAELGARLHLVEHREPYDDSLSFDVLIRGAGPTLSVGIAGPALPWPLRGVHRVSEQDLVRVNGSYLTVAQAVACLDSVLTDADLLRRVGHAAVVNDLLGREPVEPDPTALQAAVDAFRRAKGLYTAEQTARWLDRRGLTVDGLAALVERNVAFATLRRRCVGDQVDAALAERPGRYDRLVYAYAGAPVSPDDLRTDPFAAVLAAIAAGAVAGVRDSRGCDLPPGLAELSTVDIGVARAGVLDGDPVHVVLLARHPATDDPATRTVIERDLFQRRLDAELDRGDVEWYWGNPATTAAVGG